MPAADQKVFFGIWCPQTIGRINVAGVDPKGAGGGELIDNLQLWREVPQVNCDEPGVCGNFVNCQDDPDCLCFRLADGTPFCGLGTVPCDGLTPCPDGTCPPGFVCQVDTCCDELAVCVSVETKCTGAAAPQGPPVAPGTLTTGGIAVEDVPAGPAPLDPAPEADPNPVSTSMSVTGVSDR